MSVFFSLDTGSLSGMPGSELYLVLFTLDPEPVLGS